ncbi:transmembrane amino acid transporter protein-domain-containing protein [Microdochium trichocladiopsis]|uniref:Transmembrane amino acid transporter protein-domain-containing protein n=1 Tax=Microdochium trichocladiopsis TaxID=1682393 RepID=A0A9P8YDJ5_9PEZI|nr:transmembrane amino acid transporter protein-domain-containing protein [Microdochium trichocladiopsis]KAH7037264.1 transmembrane amino acid transporter protein-domain-containing protein [Microdochium trichocladiopsis]
MPNYSSISDAQPGAPAPSSSPDMTRARRVRNHQKDAHIGSATMISCIVNLLNTIIGAGTLAMPSAMSHFGILLGVVVILWSGFTSAFGLYLQSRCSRYLDRGSASFFALSQLTYPNAAVIFDAAIAIKCFGVGISYMIIIGDLMPGVAEGFSSRAVEVAFLMNRNFWITAFMLIIIPLCFLRRLDSLKYTSVVALIAIGYLIILVVYHFATDPLAPREKVRIISWGGPVEALSSLPVVVFAYTCHQNMFSILNELDQNTPARIMGVISSSIGSAAGVYCLVAVTGYLTFGNDVASNIVGQYPASIASTIAKAAIVVLVTFSVPLQVHPCRASVDAVLRWRPSAVSGAANRSNSPGRGPLLPAAGRSDHGSGAAMSELRFALLSTAILVLSYTVALSVTSLERVLAYVGATGSTSISFILPGLFYYKISDPDSIHHQRLAKDEDDPVSPAESDVEDDDQADDGVLGASVDSLRSNGSAAHRGRSARSPWHWRTKWRWDMDHIDPIFLRRAAAALATYGFCVMAVCLGMNLFGSISAH